MTPDSELELSQIVRRYGIKGAKEIWEIPTYGIKLVDDYIKKYDIKLKTKNKQFLNYDKIDDDSSVNLKSIIGNISTTNNIINNNNKKKYFSKNNNL